MRMFLGRLLEGRNGNDELNRAIMGIGVACAALSVFLPWTQARMVFHYVLIVTAAIWFTRMVSRNLPRRLEENRRFLAFTGRLRDGQASRRAHAEQRRAYKIFKCPSCGTKLRVPRGKGRIKVTCRQCGAVFEEKS